MFFGKFYYHFIVKINIFQRHRTVFTVEERIYEQQVKIVLSLVSSLTKSFSHWAVCPYHSNEYLENKIGHLKIFGAFDLQLKHSDKSEPRTKPNKYKLGSVCDVLLFVIQFGGLSNMGYLSSSRNSSINSTTSPCRHTY